MVCPECGKHFVVAIARMEFDFHFNGDLNYDDLDERLCGDCAIELCDESNDADIYDLWHSYDSDY